MEKRKFPRQGLGVEAIYVFDDDNGNSGVIHDFSQDGLFITYGDDSQFETLRRQRVAQGASVDIILADGERQISLAAALVHFNESGIGLSFVGNKFRSYQTLVQARQRSNAVVEETTRQFVNGHRINDESRRIKILNACNAHLKEFLDDTLNEFLNRIDDVLLNEADRQKNDAAQHPYFDAIAHFKRHRKTLPGVVIGKITSDALDIVHGRYKPPVGAMNASANDQSLSLVDKSDFEEWLIVRVVVSRAELQLRDPLIEVQLRVDAAFGKDDGKRLPNPYSPALIAQHFHAAIHSFRLHGSVERLVFKVFQEVVLNNLTRLYKALNAEFIKNGVLPDIDITRYLAAEALKKNKATGAVPTPAAQAEAAPGVSPQTVPTKPVAAAPVAPSAAAGPAAVAAPAVTPAANVAQSFQALQEGLARARNAYSAASSLMRLHRNLEKPDSGTVRSTDAPMVPDLVATDNAIRTLTQVQEQLIQDDISLNEPGSLVRYMTQLSDVEGVVLAEQDVESAEMVENLFTNIVDHQRIVPDLKPELRKLEVPILKVLLTDPRLFSSDYHPARQFVNYVALLADKESVNLNANRPSIVDAIRFILSSPDVSNELFVDGLSRLDKIVEREKKIIERNLARVTEACEGQQRIQLANNRVEKELAERLQGKRIPSAMHDLLAGGWKDLMRLCYLREGVESRAWEMTLVVVDQLVVRLVDGEYDEARLLFKAEELQKLIEKGLSKVPDHKGRNGEIIERIRMLLLGQGADTADRVEYQPAERQPLGGAETVLGDSPEDKSQLRWISRARKLKEGQWLEFDARSTTSHLYQLAWIAEQHSRFVFVNHHGMKVADLPLEDVADKLKSGDIVVLSDAVLPAVENGLDSLVQKIYDQLAYESAHDQLTGMKTRKEFERCLAQSVARSKRESQKYALIYIDIAQFKVINNTCGYEAGDSLLRELGDRIRSVTSKDMMAGRIGGNEFGIVAPVQSDQQGYHIASELKAAIEEKRFVTSGQSFVIEAVLSLLYFDQDNDQVLELLRSAESAVAIAKKSGHKEIQLVSQGDTRIEERDEVMAWVARINRALDLNTLKLRCQKIAPVDNQGDILPHFEILLTVVDDKGEHLPPADFIRAAEEYSRMSAVDRWVIETVLRWMTGNRPMLDKIGGFSINLSGHSMNDDSFLDFMFENLVRYGVPRDKLIFEVTETTAVANLEDAADFINEMRNIGCRFSLDDFGAGQSSYAYLKRLPVDFIKIDGAFVRNIAQDDVDYALVKSITEMGHFLNKKIIAEYVSDEEIMEVVKDIGVDYVQGYFLGRPCYIEDLAAREAALS